MSRALHRLVVVAAVLTPGVATADPPATITTLPRPTEVPPPLPPEPMPVPVAELPCLPPAQQPGLFAAADIGIMFPHVTNGLAHQVTVQPFAAADLVSLPAVGLDSTVAPQFVLGYRLRDDLGAILLSYRNLAAEGREFVRDFDVAGDGIVFSRLDINTVGLAYSTHEQPLGALWALRWEAGAKLSSIYFDSIGQGPVIGQRVSNHFLGAGPAVALDLTREVPSTGFALYSRAEFADLIGQVTQRYAESVGDPRQPAAFGGFDRDGSQGVPVLALQAGLSWLSRPDGRYRLTAGYSFEHYWAVGKLGSSHGDVMAQGIFLRGEFNY